MEIIYATHIVGRLVPVLEYFSDGQPAFLGWAQDLGFGIMPWLQWLQGSPWLMA